MERTKTDKLLMENMRSVFGFALTRLGNPADAEDLAGDILLEVLRSAEALQDEDRFYGFLWKIAENTYYRYLRKKTRREKRVVPLDETVADDGETALEGLIDAEDLHLLRRELSLLSGQYRDATVLYYMDGLSCTETAKRLQISVEMVKYYLFRARKILREGMKMERFYGEKSYRPHSFEIDFWGTKAGDSAEYRDFERRKIKGNILLAAYYTPVTAQEIGMELGVALPYLEDEIALLMARQYLTKKNGKYLTNIPIFTLECTKSIEEKQQASIAVAAEKFTALTDPFFARFGERFASDNLARFQKLLLCLHFALLESGKNLAETYGDLPEDGPYSIVNGGGGKGVVWGRSRETLPEQGLPQGIQGIYNGCPSQDGRGSVIAMNFVQTLNAGRFEGAMTDPLVCAAVGCFDDLPKKWKKKLTEAGYVKDGRANFPVWSAAEYEELRVLLRESIALVSDLNRRTSEIAAQVTADLAPAHIRASAAYVGAIVYQFTAIEKLTDALFGTGWLMPADDQDKPAICVVKD